MPDKEKIAIERLKEASLMSLHYYQQPLIITDSGGKDSTVCKELAARAGIPFEIMHNHTTADAPETVRFVRSEARRFENAGYKYSINMPTYKGQRVSMWSLIPMKLMPPTRLVRYCCSILKENGEANRMICTGVRWDESNSRKNNRGIYETIGATKASKIILNNDNDDKRQLFENCKLKATRVVNPIVDWTDNDVWDFIHDAKKPINPLYEEGWHRVGCIGCPMASKARSREFMRWPKYKQLYIKSFNNMLLERKRKHKNGTWANGDTGEDVFNWWMEYDILPGQVSIEELLKEDNDE